MTPPTPRALSFGLLLAGCPLGCFEPKATTSDPQSSVGATPSETSAATTAEPATPPSASAEPTASPSSPAPSWAKRICGPGPYGAPILGARKATPLPKSEPTALDPSDKVFHLYEGAVWFKGALHFSDFKTSSGFPSRVLKYEGGALSIVIPDSGSNGLGLDTGGEHLVLARHKTKGVALLEPSGSFRQLAGEYQGKPFNSPNDVVFRSDGNLYFTDPSFQAGERADQPTTNVYRVAPNGEVTAVDTTIRNPNGISLSPDENTLYVAGNMEAGYVKSYPIAVDGSVAEGKVLLNGVAVPDGMVVDCAGNLYVTEHTQRRVRVIDAQGKELGQITGMDVNVTNVAFGGAEHKTLFITGTGRLFQIELPVPGMPY